MIAGIRVVAAGAASILISRRVRFRFDLAIADLLRTVAEDSPHASR